MTKQEVEDQLIRVIRDLSSILFYISVSDTHLGGTYSQVLGEHASSLVTLSNETNPLVIRQMDWYTRCKLTEITLTRWLGLCWLCFPKQLVRCTGWWEHHKFPYTIRTKCCPMHLMLILQKKKELEAATDCKLTDCLTVLDLNTKEPQ